MTDHPGTETEPETTDADVDPLSDEDSPSGNFRVIVATIGLLLITGVVASFLVARPAADRRSASEPTRGTNGSPTSDAADSATDTDEELRDFRDLRVDGVALDVPAGWTPDLEETDATHAAFRHRDRHLVTMSVAEFDGRGPRTDAALVEEVEFLAESLEEASSATSFDFDDPLVDTETDVRRAFLYGTRTQGGASTRIRIMLSFYADIGRMLFVSLEVEDPLLADEAIEEQFLDLIPWFETDAFDPDASFEPAAST